MQLCLTKHAIKQAKERLGITDQEILRLKIEATLKDCFKHAETNTNVRLVSINQDLILACSKSDHTLVCTTLYTYSGAMIEVRGKHKNSTKEFEKIKIRLPIDHKINQIKGSKKKKPIDKILEIKNEFELLCEQKPNEALILIANLSHIWHEKCWAGYDKKIEGIK